MRQRIREWRDAWREGGEAADRAIERAIAKIRAEQAKQPADNLRFDIWRTGQLPWRYCVEVVEVVKPGVTIAGPIGYRFGRRRAERLARRLLADTRRQMAVGR